MMNPNASLDERFINGALATLSSPVAVLDMMSEAFLNAPNGAARAGQLFAQANVTNNTDTRLTSIRAGIIEMTNAFNGALGPFAGVVGVPQRVMTVEELALQRFQGAEATRAARATYAARAAFNQAARGAGFTPVEIEIMYEAQAILGSREINAIRAAHESGESVVVNINGRAIQYEPGMPFSGLSDFGNNGFFIGSQAFASEAEFELTILHELQRLYTSASPAGLSGELAAAETAAAQGFADSAYAFLHGAKK